MLKFCIYNLYITRAVNSYSCIIFYNCYNFTKFGDKKIMIDFNLFSILLIILSIIIIYTGVKPVPQSEQWTVERFGKYIQTLKPGLNFIIPFADSIGAKISLRESVLDVPSQDVITKDNATVRVDGVVFYQVLDCIKAAYEVSNLEIAITNLTITNIRTVMGEMDLDELLSNREKINASLLSVVDEATDPWGIKINRIEIKDITPPRDLIDSMARQMKAEREKRANILEAEGLKEAAILKAEGTKQADILEAEGKMQSEFKVAEARERMAIAEAKATTEVSNAIAKGNLHAINYFVAEKYVDALKEMASSNNQKVIFMPLEASNVIGALGGVAELTKEVFKKGK